MPSFSFPTFLYLWMGCLFFGINTLWLADPDRGRVSSSFASLCASKLYFPVVIFMDPMRQPNQITQPTGILFFSLFSTVPIPPVLPGLLLPLVSWPDSQLPFCRLLCHLPTPIALCTSLITWLELFMSVFYFWETMCLMTWLLCHSFWFAQWLSPVLATLVEWMTRPALLLMLSQFVVAYFSFLPMRTSCQIVLA